MPSISFTEASRGWKAESISCWGPAPPWPALQASSTPDWLQPGRPARPAFCLLETLSPADSSACCPLTVGRQGDFLGLRSLGLHRAQMAGRRAFLCIREALFPDVTVPGRDRLSRCHNIVSTSSSDHSITSLSNRPPLSSCISGERLIPPRLY